MITTLSIGSFRVTLWAVLAAALGLAACIYTVLTLRRRGWKPLPAVFCCAAAAVAALLLGRPIFFAVRPDTLMSPMGDYLGLGPVFDPSVGSANVIGVILGLLLGTLAASACAKKRAVDTWDALAVPGLLLFAAFRFIEPLSGQGFGAPLTNPAFCFVPVGISPGGSFWMLSVCFIEGVLLLVSAGITWKLKLRSPGSKTLCALILLSVLQIVPESLRCDNVLKIHTFVRVTQLGYAITMAACAAIGWKRSRNLGTGKGAILREAVFLVLGIGALVAAEFALDKAPWPDWAVYLGMDLVLLSLLWMLMRRLIRNDRIGAPKTGL